MSLDLSAVDTKHVITELRRLVASVESKLAWARGAGFEPLREQHDDVLVSTSSIGDTVVSAVCDPTASRLRAALTTAGDDLRKARSTLLHAEDTLTRGWPRDDGGPPAEGDGPRISKSEREKAKKAQERREALGPSGGRW